jgi:large subunit ribosomal protein L31e
MTEKTETKPQEKEIKKVEEKKEKVKSEPKKEEKKEQVKEKEYIIPLSVKWAKVPRYKRANKAIRTIKEFLVRHMKVYDKDLKKIKIDKYLNEMVWFRGIKKPPRKIKVKVRKEGEIVRVEAAELLSKIKFKKDRIERIKKAATETKKKKKVSEQPEEKPAEEQPKPEEAKKEEEKKSAVVEAGQERAKKAAKATKHQTKISKQPKRQMRQALKK